MALSDNIILKSVKINCIWEQQEFELEYNNLSIDNMDLSENHHFIPEFDGQDEAERREIRHGYRKLQDDIHGKI